MGYKAKVFLLLCIWLCSNHVYAQLTVSGNSVAYQLARVIAGPGVNITNAYLNCPQGASGKFQCNCNLGLDSGIILTNGYAASAQGPNDTIVSQLWYLNPGDADLAALVGQDSFSLYDNCSLEFDIEVLGDSLQFQYVFGSEEYPEFICTEFNDAFGFFIKGPGIAGTQNIALVPGTNMPVSINTINNGPPPGAQGYCTGQTYPQYFMNNGTDYNFGTYTYSPPNSTSSYYVQYNGLTTLLTAAIGGLIPCSVYHLKLAIDDVADSELDSGVFIAANSLKSNVALFEPAHTTSGTDNIAVPGCNDGVFTLTYLHPVSTTGYLHFTIGGTAVNGVNYTSLPDSVLFNAGDSAHTITVHPLGNIPGGVGTVVLYLYSSCNATTPYDSTVLYIVNTSHISVSPHHVTICAGDTVQLHASGGAGYAWAPPTGLSNPNIADPVASPVSGIVYTCTSGTGNCASHDTVHVDVMPVPPFTVNAGPDDTSCSGTGIQLNPVVAGNMVNNQPFTYTWAPASGLSDTAIINPVATPTVPTQYVIKVASGNCSVYDTVNVVLGSLKVQVQVSDITCNSGNKGSLNIQLTGGVAPYYYTLKQLPSGQTVVGTGSFDQLPAGKYMYTVSDNAGCTITDSVYIKDFVKDSVGIQLYASKCKSGQALASKVTITPYTADNGPFKFSADNGAYQDSGVFINLGPGHHTFDIVNSAGCHTKTDTIVPNDEITSVTIMPHDTTLLLGQSVQLISSLNPLPGNIISYQWTPSYGLSCSDCADPVVTTYNPLTTYKLSVLYNDNCETHDDAQVIIVDNTAVFIPNSFSPNGDGNNDFFEIYGANIKALRLTIFNRWGEKVFESTDQFWGWDGTYKGKLQNPSVYTYLAEIVFLDNKVVHKHGSFTLIR
jgi:gliding motility-associated-like protein